MAKRKARCSRSDDLRPAYDLTRLEHPVRGKYHPRAVAGSNIVLLDADVAAAFPTAEDVNAALRLLLTVARKKVARHRRPQRTA